MTRNANGKMAPVFDLGGVLLDWNPRHLYLKLFNGDALAVERFLAEIGFVAWNVEQDRGRSFADGVAALIRQFPQHADLIRAYDVRWSESILGPIQANVDLVCELRRAGYPLFGLTNFSTEKYRWVRSQYEFLGEFDDVIVSGDVRLIKPDPRIFELLLTRTGRPAGECVFIDDSERNVIAAREAGLHSIHYRSSHQLRAELGRHGIP